jgi:tRNA pseudouridine55 synthase
MGRRKGQPVHGWIIVDKPAGMGSTTVVNRLRHALGAQKAGHAGTLDPDATGVLAVAFGEATKTIPFVMDASKDYTFMVRWGAETTTDDAAGVVTATSDLRPDRPAILAALPAFRGLIAQVPPQVSAVKVDGARAYDLARDGATLDLAARDLMVDRLDLLDQPDPDHARLAMTCGKGGYVRSIARDLGRALGCLGHVAWLRRDRAGPFSAAGAMAADDPDPARHLRPLETALTGLPVCDMTPAGALRLSHGNAGEVAATDAAPGDTAWARHDGHAIGIGRYAGGLLHPDRVFNL